MKILQRKNKMVIHSILLTNFIKESQVRFKIKSPIFTFKWFATSSHFAISKKKNFSSLSASKLPWPFEITRSAIFIFWMNSFEFLWGPVPFSPLLTVSIFTFGIFLIIHKRISIKYYAIPLIVALGGFLAAYRGIYEDIGLIIAGLLGTYLIIRRNKHITEQEKQTAWFLLSKYRWDNTRNGIKIGKETKLWNL